MKNILEIFRADIRGLTRNFFALVVAGGLCFLPALYAWFNIYSNWDPYGNTGNIKIAVVSEDKGWTKDDGEKVNMGKNVCEELKEKDSICWIFLDKREDALEGVKAGDYYAAVVFDEDFTYGMYHGVAENIEDPKMTYYVNGKKNAVATKITDSAVGSVENSINKQFIRAIAEGTFEEANSLSENWEEEDAVDQFILELKSVNEQIESYKSLISTFMEANNTMQETTDTTGANVGACVGNIESGKESLAAGQESLEKTKVSFNNYSVSVNAILTQVTNSLSTISTALGDLNLEEDARKLAEDRNKIAQDTKALSDSLDKLVEELEKTNLGGINDNTIKAIKYIQTALAPFEEEVDPDAVVAGVTASVSLVQTSLTNYQNTIVQVQNMYNNQVVPQVNAMITSMSAALSDMQDLLTNLSATATSMQSIFEGVGDTLNTLNMSLEQLLDVLTQTGEKITETLESLEDASESEQLEILLSLLQGDAKTLGEFFAEPVQVEENFMYEISNYGSGVAPFYTVLAIWVGMTILVSLIKVHAKSNHLLDVKPSHLFFGRYLTFFVLSEIQAMIIVIGNLLLLKVQCKHPGLLFLTAFLTSLTFSLLVYSLTIAFGDVGKAFAVVIMVIQIAGSGGTYPIEALPKFFQGVYIFFPFPYAINAMRECIGGMYENDILIYFGELLLFAVASLVIGLVIRIPFIGLNHYVEERMEDTKMM